MTTLYLFTLLFILFFIYIYIGTQAGDAFTEAAKLYERGSSAKFEGSKAYESAAKCYKRQDPQGKKNET